jgi:uncharacterized lipoprotein YmbA
VTSRPFIRSRRQWLAGAALLAGVGCASPTPPPRLYRLASGPSSTADPTTPFSTEVWELAPRVVLPEYLDRETLVTARGVTGLDALAGHRWAEPLRDSLPRLLREDLSRRRGESAVWLAPAPAGLQVDRRLQVELQTLLATEDLAAVTLQARWWLTDARFRAKAGATATSGPHAMPSTVTAQASDHSSTPVKAPDRALPILVGRLDVQIPCRSRTPDGVVAAHRDAIYQLALRIAASGDGASTGVAP